MAGRPPKEKSFFNALSVALREAHGTTLDGSPNTNLRRIADKLVEAALAGESWAIREVADRTDGKAMQAVEVSGEITDGTSKEQRDAAFAAALMAEADERKAKLN